MTKSADSAAPPPPFKEHCGCTSLQYETAGDICVKRSTGYCSPLSSAQCPSDMDLCTRANVGSFGDTPGKWANRRCARKVRKNKCHKRRVRKNCKQSCARVTG